MKPSQRSFKPLHSFTLLDRIFTRLWPLRPILSSNAVRREFGSWWRPLRVRSGQALRDSVPVYCTYPGLTSGAIMFRPFGAGVRKSLTRHWLLCRDCGFQFRLGWNNDPCEQVGDDARTNSGSERDEEAEDAHERYVEIEILS